MQTIPNDDCSIPRGKMPQIDEKDIPELIVFLYERGVKITAGYIDPMEVRAHQAVDKDMAMGIPEEILRKPALLSSDPFVLDGDHRWYRHFVDRTQMPFIQLSVNFEEALSHLFAFPKTYELTAITPIRN